MQYSIVAVLAAAAGVSASYGAASNATVVTEVVESYTTYCPFATQLTHGSHTYTVTAPGTVTITDCPCTITHPVYTTSEVVSTYCPPTGNATIPPPPPATSVPVPTGGSGSTPTGVTAGAGRTAVLSGAGLAGLVGLVAFAL